MDLLHIYAVGDETVVLSSGVGDSELEACSEQIIKQDALGVQAGFIKNSLIQIPRIVCAGDYFSAEIALCFGKYLTIARTDGETRFRISTSGAHVPFTVEDAGAYASFSLAGKAKSVLTGSLPCVIFGSCAYYISDTEPQDAPVRLQALATESPCRFTALLVKKENTITPYFAQKGSIVCGFSAGSAAIALAFWESETTRNYFQQTYRFPKGERTVRIKRFLSEAFECTLTAQIKTFE